MDEAANFFLPALTPEGVEAILKAIHPTAPCREEGDTDAAHARAQTPEPATPLLSPSTSEVGVKERKKTSRKKRSRRPRATARNPEPCFNCQLVQKGCIIVHKEPRLCARCEKEGLPKCPPHGSRRRNIEQRASELPQNELSPFMGVFSV